LLKDIEKVLRKPIPQLPLPHFKRAQPQPEREQRHHAPKPAHSQSKPQQPHGQQRNNRRRRWNRSRPQASAR
jgi:hypothetical protein